MAKAHANLTRSQFDALLPQIKKAIVDRLKALKPLGAPPPETDVFDRVVEVASKLVATEVRPAVETVMGQPFPLRLIKKGGYETVDDAVKDLLEKIRDWCAPNRAKTGAAGK